MASEASYLLSGFGTYTKEVLGRLHATGKYEIAEFASYAKIGDVRDNKIPWMFYPNAVDSKDPRWDTYQSKNTNQFGEWRFEAVCLDFKPDVVIDIRDPWMLIHECWSPVRPYFHHILMPTVDSAPQRDEWVDAFMTADRVFTYSDWGAKVLSKQSNGQCKLERPAYPGVNLNLFQPMDKKVCRKAMGIPEDAFIIGTVMRNQTRKLYPNLFRAFRKFLDTAPKELADKTYLYAHTSYPDVGWDIPALLKEHDVGHKTFFTYIDRTNNKEFCSLFQDGLTYSPFSHGITAIMPTVTCGLSQEQLAGVFNLFDVYVQYAICEGFGMPQAEAAACGVPLMSVNYSAMEDQVRITKGIPLKVGYLFREVGTNADRVYPDDDYTANAWIKFFSQSESYRKDMGVTARKAAEKHFNWDVTAKIWEEYLDRVQLTGLQGQWDTAPIRQWRTPPPKPPEGMTNYDFWTWCYNEILEQPNEFFSVKSLDIQKDLNYGATRANNGMAPINQEIAYKHILQQTRNKNICEKIRTGQLKPGTEDFVQYAHARMR